MHSLRSSRRRSGRSDFAISDAVLPGCNGLFRPGSPTCSTQSRSHTAGYDDLNEAARKVSQPQSAQGVAMPIPANVRIIAVVPVAVTFPITATCMTDTRDCRKIDRRLHPRSMMSHRWTHMILIQIPEMSHACPHRTAAAVPRRPGCARRASVWYGRRGQGPGAAGPRRHEHARQSHRGAAAATRRAQPALVSLQKPSLSMIR